MSLQFLSRHVARPSARNSFEQQGIIPFSQSKFVRKSTVRNFNKEEHVIFDLLLEHWFSEQFAQNIGRVRAARKSSACVSDSQSYIAKKFENDYSENSRKRPPLMSGLVVAYGRWSLTGSFINSNLIDRGTNQDFG